MKYPITALLCLLALCPSCFSQDQPIGKSLPTVFLNPTIENKDGASVATTTEKGSYSGDEDMKLFITLKNTGKKSFDIFPSDVESFYKIEVTGPGEKKLLPKKLPRSDHEQLFGSSQNSFVSLNSEEVSPGQTKKAVVWLNNLFDMSLPGTYKVTALTVFQSGTKGEDFINIEAKPLTIKVLSAPPLSQWVN